MSFKVVVAGISVSTIFGFSFLFTKNALDFVSPMNFLVYRFFVASVVFLFLLSAKFIKIEKKPYWRLWKLILFQPIFYFIFETHGVDRINSSEAGMIIALIPIVVNVLSRFVLKEKADFLHYTLVAMGFFGVILIVGFNLSAHNILGKIFMLLAVLSAAMYTLFSRRLSKEFEPQEITFFMMISGFLFFSILNLFTGQFKLILNFQIFASALYLGILSSAVAFFLLNYMVKKASPTLTTVFSNLTTVVSVIAGVIFRKETIGIQQIVGMILILSSLLMITIRAQKTVRIERSI
ncbi:MAG: DMT family transporter [Pseudothermotoga sp.]|uniref:DMT family transporter n=1 Tax=Pseudothermotoga sp. TaxID=2033661 RepID=UPI00258CDD85|nr:DMT family transporter [Pseudothermotoga sp.]MDI6863443.1 DMT family transporter [Pseudothermotoga sp.]